jgi:hypothetical protein
MKSMQSIVRTRLISFIAGLIIVPVGTILVVLFAKGYRPDLQSGQITVSGILSTHTYPENAQIFIDGKLMPSVTNSNLNLLPGEYTLEFKKEGFQSWKKNLKIEKEIVTTATAVLFPSVPALKPVSSQSATRVTLSPDGTRVAFLSKSNQVYTLDLSESALGMLNRESRLAGSLPISLSTQNLQLIWSPDSRYILATDYAVKSSSPSAFFIDPGNQEVTTAGTSLTYLLQSWKDRQKVQDLQKFNSLPPALKDVLATSSANISWAPRENKLLYTATASASLPLQVKKPLPGSSTQFQKRDLTPGEVYIYDLEEDRNFLLSAKILPSPTPIKTLPKKQKIIVPISPSPYTSSPAHPSGWAWFPTSSHLYRVEDGKIIIIEYDNQNPVTIYSGLLLENTAIPYPSGKQMLLLTNFSVTPAASSSAQPTLYALTLR